MLSSYCYSFRPDAQLFEGQEEEQINRELPDDIFRRQLINNLAKHVLFSKKSAITQLVILLFLRLQTIRLGTLLSVIFLYDQRS